MSFTMKIVLNVTENGTNHKLQEHTSDIKHWTQRKKKITKDQQFEIWVILRIYVTCHEGGPKVTQCNGCLF